MDADPARPPEHRGRDPPHRIEGQRGHTFVRGGRPPPSGLVGGVQHRLVEGVRRGQLRQLEGPQSAERGPPQYAGVGQVRAVDGLFDHGPVLGQRPRLVQAQHIDGTQVVQGGQPFDDHSAGTGEPGRTPCERGGDEAGRLEDCFAAVDYFKRRRIPFVVAVNRFPGARTYAAHDVSDALDLDGGTPVVLCDARDRDSGKDVLIRTVEYAGRMHTARLLDSVG
ncbi:hypothetical protein SVIOM74S_07982 [Streptomyces violarus]